MSDKGWSTTSWSRKTEKRIQVPEGMLMEARKRWPESATGEAVIRDRIEAALQWLSDNPIVPTDEQVRELFEQNRYGVSREAWRVYFTEWQRRMFLAPDPVEDYADRILKNASPGYTPTHAELDKIWEHIFRAGHGWVPPELRNRGDEFSDRMNDLTVEVNRVGMKAAIEILQKAGS